MKKQNTKKSMQQETATPKRAQEVAKNSRREEESQFSKNNRAQTELADKMLSGFDFQGYARYNLMRMLREGNWEATQYVLNMGIK